MGTLKPKTHQKIREFLTEQKRRNEKMASGSDPLDFGEAAHEYEEAMRDFDKGNYRKAKGIIREELRQAKNIARIFGKKSARRSGVLRIRSAVKELFAI